jgi:hypothetical protein
MGFKNIVVGIVTSPRKRDMAGEYFVQRHSQAVQIGACVQRQTADLLWGHVVNGSGTKSGFRQLIFAEYLSDAKIGQLQVPVLIDQQVGRLDITMDDANASVPRFIHKM